MLLYWDKETFPIKWPSPAISVAWLNSVSKYTDSILCSNPQHCGIPDKLCWKHYNNWFPLAFISTYSRKKSMAECKNRVTPGRKKIRNCLADHDSSGLVIQQWAQNLWTRLCNTAKIHQVITMWNNQQKSFPDPGCNPQPCHVTTTAMKIYFCS